MNSLLRRIWALFLCLCVLLPFAVPAQAAEATETEASETRQAEDISSAKYVTSVTGFTDWGYFFDEKVLQGGTSSGNASMTIEYEDGIGSVYFIFRYEYGEYTVTNNDTGETKTVGQGSFLHDFLDLEGMFGTAPTSVTIKFENGDVRLNEVYIFTPGETPDFVQKWDMPVEDETDMILFSTHGDDEQLFFAGLLPYYANALDYQVQVVYLTDHRNNTNQRVHEMLNGLWAVGCTTYPVFGSFADFLYDTMEQTYAHFETLGTTRDDIIEFCVEQIRRFNPLVVVAHDFAGEYAHGQHMVYADCVAAALEISNDATQYPELAEKYGTWDVPKAYFHLYEENQITMDWDTPMEELDGMTPFEVTQKLGFPCHESQQWTWFYKWINGKNDVVITKASEIATYSPCLFGLYRTTVGPDVEKNDFFENLTTYAEQKRLAQEELERQQAAAQATETQPTEEAEKSGSIWDLFNSDQDSKTSQIAKQEAAQQSRETAARKNKINGIILGTGFGLIALLLIYNLWQERERKRRRKRRPKPRMDSSEK